MRVLHPTPVLAMLLLPTSLLAAVEGTIVNATTNQPQPNATVNLVQPGASGMQTLGSTVSGADGAFEFDQTPAPGGPALIQATHGEVTYTQIVPPGRPTTGLQVRVYESTAEPPGALSTQHLILFEPGAATLEISETFLARNDANLTYQDTRNGSLRLYLPEGAPESLQMTVNSTGVDVQRPVEKTQTAGLYKVNYPIRPGETRFDLHYSLPATATFTGKVVYTTPPTRLVTPGTVVLTGNGLRDIGTEPQSGARVYEFAGDSYTISIQGVGSLRGPSAASPEETGQPVCCEQVPAQIHSQMGWVLGLGLAILALGGALLFRKGSAGAA